MNIINETVIENLRENTKRLLDVYEDFGLNKTPKNISEDISGLLETAIERNVEGAIAPKVDSEPDIRYNGKAVEIKTSAGTNWRGGTFSKRPGYYIFVTYELDENNNIKMLFKAQKPYANFLNQDFPSMISNDNLLINPSKWEDI